MPISYTTIPKPSVPTYTGIPSVATPSYTKVSELAESILDEAGIDLFDEDGNHLKLEQRPIIFTSVVTPA